MHRENSTDLTDFIASCLSGRGSDPTPPELVMRYIPQLSKAGYVISAMESDKVLENGLVRPDFQFALLGLSENGDDDWSSHRDPERITRAAMDTLRAAIASSDTFQFCVWIDHIKIEGPA